MAADGSDEFSKKICVACNNEFSQGETICPHDGTALTPLKKDNWIGTVLGGRYEIEEKIGSGAMGEVYKAKHRLMKRQVAIKMMHPQTISGANALKRFQKEAEMASALNHPNILAVHDFGVADDGSPYLVMNYLEGRSLTDEIEGNGHLDVSRSLHIFRQLCQGLGHAHEKGVIHRDLKPSNIMLVTLDQDTDFVQILDFGIAKQLTEESSADSLTRTGEVFGSPHYMSPEQCRAMPVDARSDIYALGCVMYRVLTGMPPLMGGDLVECLYKHVNEMPAPFSQLCPEFNLPEDLEAVIFKAVAKKPEDRWQTMGELKNALESVGAYKMEIATKTYGSLAGLKASATLTSLPASASIDYGAQATDPSTATSTAATTVSATTIAAAAGPLVKNKASQTGDLPAMQQAEAAEQAVRSGENDAAAAANNNHSDAARSGQPAGNSTLAANAAAQAASAAAPAHGNAGGASNGGAGGATAQAGAKPAGGALLFGLVPLRTALIIAIPLALVVIVGVCMLTAPSGSNKITKLQAKAKQQYEQGKYGQAEQSIREAINEGKKKSLPDDDISYYLLGEIQYAEADYTNAQSSLEQALKLRQAKYGPSAKETSDVQALLGTTLTAEGSYRKAELMLQQSYQSRKALSGDNSALVADSLAGLGYLYVREHSYTKAISDLTNALHIIQAANGDESPEAAAALCNLGEAYQWSGNWTQAEALYKQALIIRKKKLDANSPTIADSYKRLSSVYLAEGNLMQAKSFLEQALAIQEKSLDSASPQLAQTRQELASVSGRLGGRRHR